MVLPAFMQRGNAQYMTSGSLIDRQEVDLETGHSLCEDWTTEIIYLSAKTNKTKQTKKTYFTQVNFLNLLTDKNTFLVYKSDKYLRGIGHSGIPLSARERVDTAYVHKDTHEVRPVVPRHGPVTHSTYEGVCDYMLSYVGDDPSRKKIFICYNLPKYLGYFKHFFQGPNSTENIKSLEIFYT